MLSRKAAEPAGSESSPRSPAAMSPATKFSKISRTPASPSASTNRSTSWSGGTGSANGHQNSTASNPADRAAAGRFSSGSSVNKMEQLTSNRWS